jgi:hypothetical protein
VSYFHINAYPVGGPGRRCELVFEKRFTRTCTDFSRRVQKDFLYGAVLFELKQDPEVPRVIARILLALPNGSEVALHEFCSQLPVVCLALRSSQISFDGGLGVRKAAGLVLRDRRRNPH